MPYRWQFVTCWGISCFNMKKKKHLIRVMVNTNYCLTIHLFNLCFMQPFFSNDQILVLITFWKYGWRQAAVLNRDPSCFFTTDEKLAGWIKQRARKLSDDFMRDNARKRHQAAALFQPNISLFFFFISAVAKSLTSQIYETKLPVVLLTFSPEWHRSFGVLVDVNRFLGRYQFADCNGNSVAQL